MRPWLDIIFRYALVVVGTWVLARAGATLGFHGYIGLFLAIFFLFVAVTGAQRDPEGPDAYGLAFGGFLLPTTGKAGGFSELMRSAAKEGKHALLWAVCIFPVYLCARFWLFDPQPFFRPELANDVLNFGYLEFALTQWLVVALPEEALFRGFFQTRILKSVDRSQTKLRGHTAAIVSQSLLFAGVHIVTQPHPARLAVFFPGLLFGWIRMRRGGIGASTALHTFSNLLAHALTGVGGGL